VEKEGKRPSCSSAWREKGGVTISAKGPEGDEHGPIKDQSGRGKKKVNNGPETGASGQSKKA